MNYLLIYDKIERQINWVLNEKPFRLLLLRFTSEKNYIILNQNKRKVK